VVRFLLQQAKHRPTGSQEAALFCFPMRAKKSREGVIQTQKENLSHSNDCPSRHQRQAKITPFGKWGGPASEVRSFLVVIRQQICERQKSRGWIPVHDWAQSPLEGKFLAGELLTTVPGQSQTPFNGKKCSSSMAQMA
jgi:hypothetical protein